MEKKIAKKTLQLYWKTLLIIYNVKHIHIWHRHRMLKGYGSTNTPKLLSKCSKKSTHENTGADPQKLSTYIQNRIDQCSWTVVSAIASLHSWTVILHSCAMILQHMTFFRFPMQSNVSAVGSIWNCNVWHKNLGKSVFGFELFWEPLSLQNPAELTAIRNVRRHSISSRRTKKFWL